MKTLMLLLVVAVGSLSGCGILTSGEELTASLGVHRVDEHETKSVMYRRDVPLKCYLWSNGPECQSPAVQGS